MEFIHLQVTPKYYVFTEQHPIIMTCKFCKCFLTLRTILGTPGTLPQAPTNLTSLTVLQVSRGQTQPQRFQSPSTRLLPRCLLLRVTFLPLDPSASMPGSPTPVARPHVQAPAGPCFPPFLTWRTWTWPSKRPSRVFSVRSSL